MAAPSNTSPERPNNRRRKAAAPSDAAPVPQTPEPAPAPRQRRKTAKTTKVTEPRADAPDICAQLMTLTSDLQAQVAAVTAERDQVKSTLGDELAGLKADLAAATAEIAQTRGALALATAEIAAATAERDDLRAHLAAVENQLQCLRAEREVAVESVRARPAETRHLSDDEITWVLSDLAGRVRTLERYATAALPPRGDQVAGVARAALRQLERLGHALAPAGDRLQDAS